MFLDLQDTLLLAIIVLGTTGAALLLLLRARVREGQKKRLWGVYTLTFLWVYIISDIAEHINRVYSPHDPKGTMFARAFLLIGIALVVYLRISERPQIKIENKKERKEDVQQ